MPNASNDPVKNTETPILNRERIAGSQRREWFESVGLETLYQSCREGS